MNSRTDTQAGEGEDALHRELDAMAAIALMHDNFEVRRLLLVCLHITVPALMVFTVTLLAQGQPIPTLAWLTRHAVIVAAAIGALTAVAIAIALTRTHLAITRHAAVVNARLYGCPPALALNWKGVSVNFLVLVILSFAAVAWLLLWSMAGPIPPAVAYLLVPLGGAGVMSATLGPFKRAHRRAAERATLVPRADDETLPTLEAMHRRVSIGDTTLDIVIVTTMAIALFAGVLTTLAAVGGIDDAALTPRRVTELRSVGPTWLALYGVLAMLFSQRILLRLRVAEAEHTTELRRPRYRRTVGDDTAWAFAPFERTFVLYTLIGALAAMLLVIAYATIGAPYPALCWLLVLAYLAAATGHYKRTLRREEVVYVSNRAAWEADIRRHRPVR